MTQNHRQAVAATVFLMEALPVQQGIRHTGSPSSPSQDKTSRTRLPLVKYAFGSKVEEGNDAAREAAWHLQDHNVNQCDALLLAIDCGTQSVRALLFDLAGNLVGRAQETFNDYQSPHPGWHQHDGEAFWQATARCCRQLWQQDDT